MVVGCERKTMRSELVCCDSWAAERRLPSSVVSVHSQGRILNAAQAKSSAVECGG